MSDKLLIRNGTVLSLDRSVGNLVGADILIENGVITEIGPSLRARQAEVVDAAGSIVMPGFVDTHRHAWHSLFRNSGSSLVSPATVGPHYTPEHAYAATLAGLLGAAASGITTVVDWADVSSAPPFVEAVLQAHAESGLRTVLVVAEADWAGAAEDVATTATELIGAGHGPLRTFAAGLPHDDLEAWESVRRRGGRIHARVGVAPGAPGSVAALGEAGLLGADVTLVHCTNLGDEDLDAIAASGTKVSLAPAMEMTHGFGWPPLQALIDRGIRPGLGIGSEMEAPGDMFAAMRAANSLQHARLFDLKLAGKGGVPNLLSTRDVIRYATSDGAGAAGLAEISGSLRPGKRADVVVLRTDRPNIAPVNDPIGAVVWGMDTSNIDWVLVGGHAVLADGRLTGDAARARELAVAAQRAVAAAAGLLADTGAARQ